MAVGRFWPASKCKHGPSPRDFHHFSVASHWDAHPKLLNWLQVAFNSLKKGETATLSSRISTIIPGCKSHRLPVHFELAARRALRHSPLRLGLGGSGSHGLQGPGRDFWGSSPTILLDKISSRFIKRSDSPSKMRSTGIPDLSPRKKPHPIHCCTQNPFENASYNRSLALNQQINLAGSYHATLSSELNYRIQPTLDLPYYQN